MESQADPPGGPKTSYGRILLLAVLALGLTLWAIQFSRRSGRLSFPPTYDDVGYFNDGLDR